MSAWQTILTRVVERPVVVAADGVSLRAALLQESDLTDAALDEALAVGWRSAAPVVRQQTLRDVLEGQKPGLQLVAAWVASITSGDDISANAAIHLLGCLQPVPLNAQQWRVIGAVAARQRDDLLPEVEAAVLLSQHGPDEAFATIALCAFRDGPEDAEDRQAAITSLGRFDREPVLEWVEKVAASGVLGLEAICAIAQWAMRHLATIDGDTRQHLGNIVRLAAGAGSQGGIHVADAWLRWGAMDLLARLLGPAALPTVAGAWIAGGEDLEPWFLDGMAQRLLDLCPDTACRAKGPAEVLEWMAQNGLEPAELRPIPPVIERVFARSPRISRRAMVLLEQSSEVAADRVAEVKRERAMIEQALVKRRQLMASFLAEPDTEQATLGDEWQPLSTLLDTRARQALLSQERDWLDELAP